MSDHVTIASSPPRRPRRNPRALRGFLEVLWRQPLWAVPFALFFGLLNDSGRGWPTYVLSYELSLVFAYSIGLALWGVGCFVAPRLQADTAGSPESATLRIGMAYSAGALIASYVAAFVIHRTIVPGFLGSPHRVIESGLFTLLFCALFAGISYAQKFYRQAVERARAVETIRAELAQAELRALRAQVHPHFLFNTLNSIAALIRIDPAAAEDTTTRLADVFRYALRASDTSHASFADELGFVREVLAIEQTRFGERLRVVEQIAPGVEAIQVPTLLLQPLVENAVRHAIAARPEGGTLTIAAARDSDLLRITVRDDGPGIAPDAPPSGTGFGLHSVRERLRALGPPHAFTIGPATGGGTEAVVTLPIDVTAIPVPSRPSTGGCP